MQGFVDRRSSVLSLWTVGIGNAAKAVHELSFCASAIFRRLLGAVDWAVPFFQCRAGDTTSFYDMMSD